MLQHGGSSSNLVQSEADIKDPAHAAERAAEEERKAILAGAEGARRDPKAIKSFRLGTVKQITEKEGNFLQSKQMMFGQDKKLAPSAIFEQRNIYSDY